MMVDLYLEPGNISRWKRGIYCIFGKYRQLLRAHIFILRSAHHPTSIPPMYSNTILR